MGRKGDKREVNREKANERTFTNSRVFAYVWKVKLKMRVRKKRVETKLKVSDKQILREQALT